MLTAIYRIETNSRDHFFIPTGSHKRSAEENLDEKRLINMDYDTWLRILNRT